MTGWSGTAVCYGPPAVMGNKKAFKTGHVVEANHENLKRFQDALKDSMRQCKPNVPVMAPVTVCVTLVFKRPQGHFRANGAQLKPDAPRLHTSRPDFDKVMRAIGDAGTGLWWHDDSYLAMGSWEKRYADIGEEPHTKLVAWAESAP